MRNIKDFITEVKALSFNNSFNPYSDYCEVNDIIEAPTIRTKNLEVMLNSVQTNSGILWVGRDPGYRGARRTGIPLTDEFHLPIAKMRYRAGLLKKATRTETIKERTASEVWRFLSQINTATLMWNVFPLHPHLPGNTFSNRAHTKKERDAGINLLDWLISTFSPKLIVSLGRDAYEAVHYLGYDTTYVRHPSYGGQTEFRESLRLIYNTK